MQKWEYLLREDNLDDIFLTLHNFNFWPRIFSRCEQQRSSYMSKMAGLRVTRVGLNSVWPGARLTWGVCGWPGRAGWF